MTILIITGAVVVIVAVIVVVSNRRFNQLVNAEIEAVFRDAADQPAKDFSYADLEDLPQPVQTYLRRSLKEGQPYARRVRLEQSGHMRLSADQPWKPFEADQVFTVDPPAFIWRARMAFLPLISVVARDKYVHRQGNMLVKILWALTVVDARGPQVSAAALIRYAAEMMWFPTALVNNPHLRWEAIDAISARAILHDGDVEATVTFHFDENGDITKVSSGERYMGTDDHPTPWYGTVRQYREFDGVRIPAEVEVGWEPETGYFGYWRGTITDVAFDV